MPRRPTRTLHPRRNPDPSLNEYLEQVFADALKAEGVLVPETGEAFFDYHAFGGENTLAVLPSGEKFEFSVGPLYLFPREYEVVFLAFGVQAHVLDADAYDKDIEKVAKVVEKAADAARLLVNLSDNFNVRDSRVYVPKGFLGKGSLYISVRNSKRSVDRISRAATEQHFPGLPRK